MADTVRNVEGQTGQTCNETGPYHSTKGANVVVFFRKGDTFLPDPDGSPTTWIMTTR